MPKVLSMVGYSASEIGIIFAASPLVRFVVPFLFTRGFKLTDNVFNTSLLVLVMSALAFYFWIDDFYKLLLANIGLGIGLSLILPYVEVIALESIGKERYGKVRLFGSIGFIVVALVLVKFLSSVTIALHYLFILVFITALLSYLLVRLNSASAHTSSNVENDVKLLRDWRLWLGLMLMQVSFGSFYNFFTIYETDHGITLDMTVYLWSFGVIIEIVMLFFQGNFLKKNLLTLLQITTFSAVIRWLLLFLFPEDIVILFISQAMHALSFALFYSASITYLYTLYNHKTLAQQFLLGVTFGFGGFIGAIFAGYMYEFLPSYLFLSSAFIALASTYFLHLWGRSIISNKIER